MFTGMSLSNVVRREEHRDIQMLIERSSGRGTTQVDREKQEWATRVLSQTRTVSHVTINLTCISAKSVPHSANANRARTDILGSHRFKEADTDEMKTYRHVMKGGVRVGCCGRSSHNDPLSVASSARR